MFGTRAAGHLTAGLVTAMALGGLVTYFRLLVGSSGITASAMVFALCVVSIAVGIVIGSHDQPDETPYW